jgi:hypothetical protein
MAPEALAGKDYNKPMDIYSLALVLYYMLTKNIPHKGRNLQAAFKIYLTKDEKGIPVLPINLDNFPDAQLLQKIQRCQAIEPIERPNLAELLSGMNQCLVKREHLGSSSTSERAPLEEQDPARFHQSIQLGEDNTESIKFFTQYGSEPVIHELHKILPDVFKYASHDRKKMYRSGHKGDKIDVDMDALGDIRKHLDEYTHRNTRVELERKIKELEQDEGAEKNAVNESSVAEGSSADAAALQGTLKENQMTPRKTPLSKQESYQDILKIKNSKDEPSETWSAVYMSPWSWARSTLHWSNEMALGHYHRHESTFSSILNKARGQREQFLPRDRYLAVYQDQQVEALQSVSKEGIEKEFRSRCHQAFLKYKKEAVPEVSQEISEALGKFSKGGIYHVIISKKQKRPPKISSPSPQESQLTEFVGEYRITAWPSSVLENFDIENWAKKHSLTAVTIDELVKRGYKYLDHFKDLSKWSLDDLMKEFNPPLFEADLRRLLEALKDLKYFKKDATFDGDYTKVIEEQKEREAETYHLCQLSESVRYFDDKDLKLGEKLMSEGKVQNVSAIIAAFKFSANHKGKFKTCFQEAYPMVDPKVFFELDTLNLSNLRGGYKLLHNIKYTKDTGEFRLMKGRILIKWYNDTILFLYYACETELTMEAGRELSEKEKVALQNFNSWKASQMAETKKKERSIIFQRFAGASIPEGDKLKIDVS